MYALLIRLRSHWLRNLLTVFQVAVAAAAVTAVGTTVMPALRQTLGAGRDVYVVTYGVETETGRSRISVFTLEDVRYLEEHAESVAAVSASLVQANPLVRVDGERYVLHSIGRVNSGYAAVLNLEMVSGAFFTSGEDQDAAPVAVVSDQLALALFGTEDAVGRIINLRPEQETYALWASGGGFFDVQALLAAPGTDLRVVGVFRYPTGGVSIPSETVPHLLVPVSLDTSPAVGLPVAGTVVVEGTAVAIVRTEGSAADVATPVLPIVSRTFSELVVRVRDGYGDRAESELKALLRSRIESRTQALLQLGYREEGLEPDILFATQASDSGIMLVEQLRASALRGVVGLAALVVAGVAVFTTTMASIAERTRSIGLARALGATRSRILRDVLGEAMLLAGLGGLIGAAAAYPLGKHVLLPIEFASLGTELAVTDVVVAGIAGTILAVAVSAAAALYPGWAAARLTPAEALREGRL